MTSLNIFDQIEIQDKSAPFDSLKKPKSQNTGFEDINENLNKNDDKKNIFDQVASEFIDDSFGFLDTLKDIGEQVVTKSVKGAVGSYGNILDALGLQTTENLLPGQKASLENNYENDFDLGLDDDILPRYARLPTSQDSEQLIKNTTGIGEGKTPAGRIAGRGAELVGEGAVLPAGNLKGLLSLGAAGVAGQSARELGAPESVASAIEIGGSIIPSAIQGRVAPRGQQNQRLANAARQFGFYENEIAPLMNSNLKAKTLSKIAHKGNRTSTRFDQIRNNLGQIYDQIKTMPNANQFLNRRQVSTLENAFQNIRTDLNNTLQASPNKQAAIDFIDNASRRLINNNATPESLINTWQDINQTVNWNSIKGGKKALSRLKEPISQILNDISPQIAETFELNNELYSRYAQISKRLKPDLVDAFVNKGEIVSTIPSAIALVSGNPWPFAGLIGEVGTRLLATEMLINPYFQNIANKLVQNINQGSVKGVENILKNVGEFMSRKYPEEKWDFLNLD